jgi:hypothetical protein
LPATEAEHVRVELPEPPVILVNDKVHTRFVEFVAIVRLTVDVKPFNGETVIVDVPAELVVTLTLVVLAAIVKS